MSKKSYKAEVFAKINLSLEIVGKAGDLHALKMLVCPYKGFSDVVEFIPTGCEGISGIEASASFESFDEARFCDFFLPKAQAIAKRLGVGGRLIVKKGVPLGTGLGGSTASIVGALKAMREYAEDLGKSTALDDGFLLKLGSDVPCMLYGESCIVEGVGEIVKPVEIPFDLSDLQVKIAEGGSDTKACYTLYDKLKAENKDIDTSICVCEKSAEVAEAVGCFEKFNVGAELIDLYKNDLTLPAAMLNENIKNLICDLKNSYKNVFLSGSGSAVVFKTHKM
ncbi:MAG: hypothetical protein K2N18_02040 [Clostridia bacterium]|nr:hypothetical protein [Clostridia bacterium]